MDVATFIYSWSRTRAFIVNALVLETEHCIYVGGHVQCWVVITAEIYSDNPQSVDLIFTTLQ